MSLNETFPDESYISQLDHDSSIHERRKSIHGVETPAIRSFRFFSLCISVRNHYVFRCLIWLFFRRRVNEFYSWFFAQITYRMYFHSKMFCFFFHDAWRLLGAMLA